jgi:hypothetical protein
MNEKDLGKALIQGEGNVDVNVLTQEVLRRDRRRVAWMMVAAVCAWMLVVLLPWSTLLPMLAKVVQFMAQSDARSTTSAAEEHERTILILQILKKGTIATFLGSMFSMFAAAICTVILIIMSRRATLRQVNMRLGEISEQLKALAVKKA